MSHALVVQSLFAAQLGRHMVPSAHLSDPEQVPEAPPQVPLPVHVPVLVYCALLQVSLPHAVVAGATSHTPPAAHLPSLPQGGAAAHWPAGAVVPALIARQLPSAPPVSAAEHALHVPVHADAQHTLSTQ